MGFFSTLRASSHQARERTALLGALLLTLAVFFVWVTTLSVRLEDSGALSVSNEEEASAEDILAATGFAREFEALRESASVLSSGVESLRSSYGPSYQALEGEAGLPADSSSEVW